MLIRDVASSDAEQLLNLIQELAIAQGFSKSEVKLTQDRLRAQLEQRDLRPFQCIVAEENGTLYAFALYYQTYSTWEGKIGFHLDDLYVMPEMRNSGLGRQLMERLIEIAHDRGCARIDWYVVDHNANAIRFYERLGAHELADWQYWRMELAPNNAPRRAVLCGSE